MKKRISFFNRYTTLSGRLLCHGLGELFAMVGNLLPRALARPMWRMALRCNPHHTGAAVNEALSLLDSSDEAEALEAFFSLLKRVANPWNTSASDLYLTWVPGRVMRRLTARLLWGAAPQGELQQTHDQVLLAACARLAAIHFRRALDKGELASAAEILPLWRSLVGETLDLQWSSIEFAWASGKSYAPPKTALTPPTPLSQCWERGEQTALTPPTPLSQCGERGEQEALTPSQCGERGEQEDSWATDEVGEQARALVEQGRFLSPLDSIRWAERFVESGSVDLAMRSLEWARCWVPEEPDLWRLLGELFWQEGNPHEAQRCWERALSLNPEDITLFLWWLTAERGWEKVPTEKHSARLLAEGAATEMVVGERCQVSCKLEGAGKGWNLFVLPPAGWGIVPERQESAFDGRGNAVVVLNARRPDRVRALPPSPSPPELGGIEGGRGLRGGAVTFVAVASDGYTTTRCEIHVPDSTPGRLLVTVTEDHEIHEERGTLPPDMLHRLLVEKSRFASSLGVPWTHIVEVGSALAMPLWASRIGGEHWQALEKATRTHLVEEVARGHDLQPHLHAFHDPASEQFPYTVTDAGWHPSLRFLLTSAEARGDWASACAPPNWRDRGFDRLQSVEQAVARLESVARLGDPNYRAVLWRSGLLDYGETANDYAWSAVALRRAGLWADSDLPKPGSPLATSVPPAFLTHWEQPFEPHRGGLLLQLPIVANLEGDYLMNGWLLRRRVRKSVANLLKEDGTFKAGLHLFTLLTHDKFINARGGQDEFRLDLEYGDWVTVRKHLEAWREAGATFVTAREGVKAVLNELSWHPIPWLNEETFITLPDGQQAIRYKLTLLGPDIPASATPYPLHLLVPIPPSLRSHIISVKARQEEQAVPVEYEQAGSAFWLMLETTENDPRPSPHPSETNTAQQTNTGRGGEKPIFCTFLLSEAIGPVLHDLSSDDGDVWQATLHSALPFRAARVLLPREKMPEGRWHAQDEEGQPLQCQTDPDGLLLSSLRFKVDGEGHVLPLRITLR